jgi:hypothetical protein
MEEAAEHPAQAPQASGHIAEASRRFTVGLRQLDEELRGLAGKLRGSTE